MNVILRCSDVVGNTLNDRISEVFMTAQRTGSNPRVYVFFLP